MVDKKETKLCPFCKKEIFAVAKKCKYCGNYVDRIDIIRECPFCCENIHKDTIKCPHCGEWLNKEPQAKETEDFKFDFPNINGGCGCGCGFLILASIVFWFISSGIGVEPAFDNERPIESCVEIGNHRGARGSLDGNKAICSDKIKIPEGCLKGLATAAYKNSCLNAYKQKSATSIEYFEMLEAAKKLDTQRFIFYGK